MSSDNPQVKPDALPPGTVVGGSWRLLERLGSGGYGAVYKVEALNDPGRYFALKLSHHPYEPRSMRELTLLMDKAVHPHIVAVHACGRWPDVVTGHFFFVMDWVPGPALHLWADLHNPSFQQFTEAARRVSLILDALHAMGVLHRDLKPEHILMRGPQGDPVLIDLGSGDYSGAPTLTTGPLPPGTLHLRSPESVRFHQRHWRRLDLRYAFAPTDDLYALGVCLYRAATGHFPFNPAWPPDVLCAAIASQQPPAPSAVNPRVPPALDGVILRLLEKDPERRFQNGAELHEALVTAQQHPAETWELPVFEWHEAPRTAEEGAPARSHRTRRPLWPAHTHRPPSVVRAKLLRLWAELLGVLRPPPKPSPHASPGKAVVEGRARRVHPRRRQRALAAAVGLVLVTGLGALGARASGAWPYTTAQVRHEATTSVGQKVASLAEAPHTGPAALPPQARPTPVAVTALVTPPQEAAPVKKTDLAPRLQTPQKQSQPPRARSVGSLARTAAVVACTGLGCASTPPLMEPPLPPAADCPPGADDVMFQKLGLGEWSSFRAELLEDVWLKPITIREGRAMAFPVTDFLEIRSSAKLSGHLYVGNKRVYGRFTLLRQDDVDYPVCFEIHDEDIDKKLGTPRHSGGDAQHAIILSRIDLRAVRKFSRLD